LKINNWDGATNQTTRIAFVPSVWADRVEHWFAVTPVADGWVSAVLEFDGGNWPAGQAYIEFQLDNSMPTGTDAYLDNLLLEKIN
jgi:hypothetical protein